MSNPDSPNTFDLSRIPSQSRNGEGPSAPTGKRSRGSTTTSVKGARGDDEGDDGGSEAGGGKRKKRIPQSCTECVRRKIKCDRWVLLCGIWSLARKLTSGTTGSNLAQRVWDGRELSFVRSKTKTESECILLFICEYSPHSHFTSYRSTYALASEVRAINRRLGHLESLFQQQKQGNGQYSLPDPSSSTLPQPHSFLDQSASSSANPSPANLAQNPPSPAHSETENAVNELEDVAFSTRVPVLRAINTAAQGNAGKRYNYAGRVDMELTDALTSILAEPLTFDQDGRPRKLVRALWRSRATDRNVNRECRSSRTRLGCFDSRFAECPTRRTRADHRRLTRCRDQSVPHCEGMSLPTRSVSIRLDWSQVLSFSIVLCRNGVGFQSTRSCGVPARTSTIQRDAREWSRRPDRSVMASDILHGLLLVFALEMIEFPLNLSPSSSFINRYSLSHSKDSGLDRMGWRIFRCLEVSTKRVWKIYHRFGTMLLCEHSKSENTEEHLESERYSESPLSTTGLCRCWWKIFRRCIILFGQYIQIFSQSGQTGRYLIWFSSAVRVAQRLGLHRLGSNPQVMPVDDPALPPGSNSLKRETAVRLFHHLVNIDTYLSDSPSLRCYVSLASNVYHWFCELTIFVNFLQLLHPSQCESDSTHCAYIQSFTDTLQCFRQHRTTAQRQSQWPLPDNESTDRAFPRYSLYSASFDQSCSTREWATEQALNSSRHFAGRFLSNRSKSNRRTSSIHSR